MTTKLKGINEEAVKESEMEIEEKGLRALNLGSKRITVRTKNSGRIFRSSYGVSPLVTGLVWNLIYLELIDRKEREEK